MGDREVPDELSMGKVEKESGVALEERVFTVGEVVEYWEGAFVRGARGTVRVRRACICEEGGREWSVP